MISDNPCRVFTVIFTVIDGWLACRMRDAAARMGSLSQSQVDDPDRTLAHLERTGAQAEARGWPACAGGTAIPRTARTTQAPA